MTRGTTMKARTAVRSVVLLLLAACVDRTDSTRMPTAPRASAATSSTTDQIIDGSTGPGSIYRLVRPANWNGQLVVYAHGYASPDQPIGFPAEGSLIIGLLAP